MIRINLIPYRVERQQQQTMQHVSAFFAVAVLAALLALGAHTFDSLQLADLKEETIATQKLNDDLKSKIGTISNLANLRSDVERKLKIIDRLQEGRFRSLKTLHAIASVIPENVWLDKIKEAGGDIELSGLSESNKAVSNFMRKLDKSPLFTNVRLGEITRVMRGGVPVRRFNLKLARVDDKPALPPKTTTSTRRKAS
ncbi:MAG: PilN domain-containing protein [Mariprofundus sp.]|nr:PilN domain-containing protein [Mariprofundus sp.]